MSKYTLGLRHHESNAAGRLNAESYRDLEALDPQSVALFSNRLEQLKGRENEVEEESVRDGVVAERAFALFPAAVPSEIFSDSCTLNVASEAWIFARDTLAGINQTGSSEASQSTTSSNASHCASVLTSCEAVANSIHVSWAADQTAATPRVWKLLLQTASNFVAELLIECSIHDDWSLTIREEPDENTQTGHYDEVETIDSLIATVDTDVEQFCAELTERLKLSQPELRFVAQIHQNVT